MDKLFNRYNREQISDRQVNELIGLAQGLLADGRVDQAEAELLHKWLIKNTASHKTPIVANLLQRVSAMLADNVLDEAESKELFETLQAFSAGNYELGELQKSTTLPLERPPPQIFIASSTFCFTGTFAYGSRKECEAAVIQRGGKVSSLTHSTNYLVIGVYATESWAHSAYGRKIEHAVEMRGKGLPIRIVGEEHWAAALG